MRYFTLTYCSLLVSPVESEGAVESYVVLVKPQSWVGTVSLGLGHLSFPTLLLFFIFIFIYLFIYLFIYFWLCWVFVSVRGLSPVVESGGHSSSRCAGLSLSRPLPLRSTGSRRAGSVVVAHRLSCSAACGIFPDQGSNPCPLR